MMGSSCPRTFASPLIQPFAPGTRVNAERHAQDLAGFFTGDQKQLARHAQRDADPFAARGALLPHLRGDRAAAALELGEQLEGTIAQAI